MSVQQVVADLDAIGASSQTPAGPPSTWAPVDLGPALDGTGPPPPTMLARTDQRCLLYPGKVHAVFGEPEACKGWLALHTLAAEIAAGYHVAYIDFEDGPETLTERLTALGSDPHAIRSLVHYIRPDEPLHNAGREALDLLLSQKQPTLAVIDGMTEALTLEGLSLIDNVDVAKWYRLLARPIAQTGAAVIVIDHVTKDREARGRFALGAQHKLAGVDAAFSLHVVEPFGRGRSGHVTLTVQKDRAGHIRQHSDSGRVADMRLASHADGTVTVALEPPTVPTTFRPTFLMERISRACEETPGLSNRAIRGAVQGKTNAKDLALNVLISEGYIEQRRNGQAHEHHPIHPYRETEDTQP